MRLFAVSTILFALFSLAGCDQPRDSTPAPAPTNRSGVEVHAPGVDVKANGTGTNFTAPGTEVHVKKQPSE